jgi:hypothetical protein
VKGIHQAEDFDRMSKKRTSMRRLFSKDLRTWPELGFGDSMGGGWGSVVFVNE